MCMSVYGFIVLFRTHLQVITGQSFGLFISTVIQDVFAAQSVSLVLVIVLVIFGEILPG